MSWQSTLKAKAHEYVTHHYLLGSQLSAEQNLHNAQELVCGTMFVRDGVNEDVCPYLFISHDTEYILQGTTWNMASPALAGLVIDFFYTGPSALGNLFPEVFAWEVPMAIVCLAATAVSTHSFHSTC